MKLPQLLPIVFLPILFGCVSGPRHDQVFAVEYRELGPAALSSSNGENPQVIALSAFDQTDSYENEMAERVLLDATDNTRALLQGVSTSLGNTDGTGIPSFWRPPEILECPPLRTPDYIRAYGVYESDDQACQLPQRLENSGLLEKLRTDRVTHAVILVANTQKVRHPTKVTWGVVGGYGGAAPAFTTETNIAYRFHAAATVYDLSTGNAVAAASTSAFDSASYGLMVIIAPYYIGPSSTKYFAEFGKALGYEINRRLRLKAEH